MQRTKNKLGIGLMFIAGLFLFNPTTSVVDVLPDVIGYIIVYFALRKLGDLNDHIDTAIQYTKRMILVSALQLVCLVTLFGVVTPQEMPTSHLLFSFAISVCEIIFLFKLFSELFEGIAYLGARHGATLILEHKRTERFHVSTVFFFVSKSVLATLPEFSALTYRDGTEWEFLYNYVELFRTLAIVIMLPIGIVWLVKLWKYVHFITKDTDFINALEEKYEKEVLPKQEIFIQRYASVAFSVLTVGMFFSLDLYSDSISIIPDFICPIFLFIGLFFLKKFGKVPLYAFAFCGGHFITSLVAYIWNIRFFESYTILLTRNTTEAYLSYYYLGVLKTVDAILFFFMICSLIPILKDVVNEHTGFAPVHENNVYQNEKIKYIHDSFSKRLTISKYIALVCAVLSPVCFYLTRIQMVTANTSVLWVFELISYLAFMIYFTQTLFAIKREMGYKYLLS